MAIPVSVKWTGQKFDLSVDLAEPGLTLKNQIYSLTGVPPERQKIMVKGGMLKDDTDLRTLGIKENHSFLVMGTAGELPKAEQLQNRKFLEDMTPAEAAQAERLPVGLENKGNTCYMNATMQCLYRIDELRDSLKVFEGSYGGAPNEQITLGVKDLFNLIQSSQDSVNPSIFLFLLRNVYPQFKEADSHGRPAQQDAEECFSQLVSSINDVLPVQKGKVDAKFVQSYMSGEFLVRMKSDEAPEEGESVSVDSFLKLTCQITMDVNFLFQGLKQPLTETIEKMSPTLNRNAVYTKTRTISRLPKYLTIHMNRMFWRDDTKKKAKIMRRVKFPFDLDVLEMCSTDLKAKLEPLRELWRLQEDERERTRKSKKVKLAAGAAPVAKEDGEKGAPKLSEYKDKVDGGLLSDTGACLTAMYELVAVLTHTGRSADSGHYMGWSRDEAGQWQKYDDDKVTAVSVDEVTQLDGGGDRAMAYLMFYKAKELN